uniref:Putative secreted peptide n=1 Tax=Anopheles braziliensis TaxID=58242 RepID=A0A2M3ZPP8_9DIPT
MSQTLMVTFPLVTLRMLNPTVGIISSQNCPEAITLTKVVLPEYWSPTSVSSISSFQKRLLNQSRMRLMRANMLNDCRRRRRRSMIRSLLLTTAECTNQRPTRTKHTHTPCTRSERNTRTKLRNQIWLPLFLPHTLLHQLRSQAEKNQQDNPRGRSHTLTEHARTTG